MTLMRTTQVNPAEEPFAMLSGKHQGDCQGEFVSSSLPTGEMHDLKKMIKCWILFSGNFQGTGDSAYSKLQFTVFR